MEIDVRLNQEGRAFGAKHLQEGARAVVKEPLAEIASVQRCIV
jgi:hypothetical protein